MANNPYVGFAAGQGLMSGQEAVACTPAYRMDTDYYIAELARGLMYAAGKAPEVRFVEAPPGVMDLPFEGNAGPAAAPGGATPSAKSSTAARIAST